MYYLPEHLPCVGLYLEGEAGAGEGVVSALRESGVRRWTDGADGKTVRAQKGDVDMLGMLPGGGGLPLGLGHETCVISTETLILKHYSVLSIARGASVL